MNTKKVLIPLAFYSLTFASNAQVSDVVAAKATPELPALEIQGRVFEEAQPMQAHTRSLMQKPLNFLVYKM